MNFAQLHESSRIYNIFCNLFLSIVETFYDLYKVKVANIRFSRITTNKYFKSIIHLKFESGHPISFEYKQTVGIIFHVCYYIMEHKFVDEQ